MLDRLTEEAEWFAAYVVDEHEKKTRQPLPSVPPCAPPSTRLEAAKTEWAEHGNVTDSLADARLRLALATGQRTTLAKLLALEFGALSTRHERRIALATAEQLDLWVERVLTAERIDDLFGE